MRWVTWEPEEGRAPCTHCSHEQRTKIAKNITYPLIKVSSPPAPSAKQPVCLPPPVQCKISCFTQACHGMLSGLMLILQQKGTEMVMVPEQEGLYGGQGGNTLELWGYGVQDPGRDGHPEAGGGGRWLQMHQGSCNSGGKNLPQSAKLSRRDASHAARRQILLSVFAYYNLTLNGERGVCIFICFGKFAWEKRAPLFVMLPKCISPQCPTDQVRVPWGQLAKTQLHVLLMGGDIFPVTSFAGPTALTVLFWICPAVASLESSRVRLMRLASPLRPKGRCSKNASARRRAAGAGLPLSAFPRKVRAVWYANHGHSCAVI